MSRYQRATKSLSASSVSARAPRNGPVRPNDDRVPLTVDARYARQHAAHVLAARTRALMLPSRRQWRRASEEGVGVLAEMWRGFTAWFGGR